MSGGQFGRTNINSSSNSSTQGSRPGSGTNTPFGNRPGAGLGNQVFVEDEDLDVGGMNPGLSALGLAGYDQGAVQPGAGGQVGSRMRASTTGSSTLSSLGSLSIGSVGSLNTLGSLGSLNSMGSMTSMESNASGGQTGKYTSSLIVDEPPAMSPQQAMLAGLNGTSHSHLSALKMPTVTTTPADSLRSNSVPSGTNGNGNGGNGNGNGGPNAGQPASAAPATPTPLTPIQPIPLGTGAAINGSSAGSAATPGAGTLSPPPMHQQPSQYGGPAIGPPGLAPPSSAQFAGQVQAPPQIPSVTVNVGGDPGGPPVNLPTYEEDLELARLGLAKVVEPDYDSYLGYASVLPEWERLGGLVVRGLV